jgi:hypothetical protein
VENHQRVVDGLHRDLFKTGSLSRQGFRRQRCRRGPRAGALDLLADAREVLTRPPTAPRMDLHTPRAHGGRRGHAGPVPRPPLQVCDSIAVRDHCPVERIVGIRRGMMRLTGETSVQRAWPAFRTR